MPKPMLSAPCRRGNNVLSLTENCVRGQNLAGPVSRGDLNRTGDEEGGHRSHYKAGSSASTIGEERDEEH